MTSSDVEIELFTPGPPQFVCSGVCSEDAARRLARAALNVRPPAASLFGLRRVTQGKKQEKHWLAPSQVLSELDLSGATLELRLRFKLSSPEKLYDVDKQAFIYYFHQVKNDFCQGEVLRNSHPLSSPVSTSRHKSLWYMPIITIESDDGQAMDKRKLDLYTNMAKLASYLVTVDVLEGGDNKSVKDVIKSASYVPNELYSKITEKIMNSGKMRNIIEDRVKYLLDMKLTPFKLKSLFLIGVEENFAGYFDSRFDVCHQTETGKSDSWKQSVLLFEPPMKRSPDGIDENEPVLKICVKSESKHGERKFDHLCYLDELCNISVGDECQGFGEDKDESWTKIELSRKNGIPVNLKIKDKLEALSFLSHVSGYYRLCEKWTFCLSSFISYPSLKYLLANNLHGPVTNEFVEEKLQCRSKNKAGCYLLRQSCDKYSFIYLHYIAEDQQKPSVLLITHEEDENLYRFKSEDKSYEFPTLRELITFLKKPDSPFKIPLRDCLHPSEYDKSPNLLLSRSKAKMELDISGGATAIEEPKVVIPLNQLSKFQATIKEGKFTNVWKGLWQKGTGKDKDAREVAIKQLKSEYHLSKMADLSKLSYSVMIWDDSTLVKAMGISLGLPQSPMSLITEYFSLGSLDVFLRNNKNTVSDAHLVEAAASIARAVWYLEENSNKCFPHGNVRCGNVFVAEHSDNIFKVKLGPPSLSDVYPPEQFHWLPLEMLLTESPCPSQCTFKGDVWALATTYWQIFSFGITPLEGVDPRVARDQYIRGDRLRRPDLLGKAHLAPIYQVMLECWNPTPDLRKETQAILRDMNQLLYKVFNLRKKEHNYVTIDEDSPTTTLSTMQNGIDDEQSSTETVVSNSSNKENGDQNEAQPEPVPMSVPANEMKPPTIPSLVPTFNNAMKHFFSQVGSGGDNLFGDNLANMFRGNAIGGRNNVDRSESTEFLLSFSRPGSSMDTSMSQLTSQTSVSSYSTHYSMPSIYELSSESQIRYKNPIGEGHFGIVYKGILSKSSSNEWDVVAVKMLKDSGSDSSMSLEAAREMRRELDIMMKLDHDNIVKIKGYLRNELDKVLIIMEFVKEGSLDQYLKNHMGYIRMPHQLFVYAQNIVDGMIYLESQGIIHRDLAARNILVANEELVKITDFGLARSVDHEEDQHYVMRSNTDIPIKCLALECLTESKYSFASDVWSFGITLWEMFSFGAPPDLVGCEDFFKSGPGSETRNLVEDRNRWIQYLDSGVRLPKPRDCPFVVYNDVMKPCWNKEPKRRPSFHLLSQLLRAAELQVT